MSIFDIKAEQCMAAEGSTTEQFLLDCTSCGACRTSCPLLENHGSPDELIYLNSPELFLCTNCGACTATCPSALDPAQALLHAKHYLIGNRNMTEQAARAVASAGRFVQWASSFPFIHYPRTATVFWPGCSLAGMAPGAVLKVRQLLSEELGQQVGLALDCCADPLYELGDLFSARERAGTIGKRLAEQGTKTVIAGCANCVKVLRRYLPELEIKHVLEVLRIKIEATHLPDTIYLHHPCPSYRLASIQEAARRLCSRHRITEKEGPQCCGQGGGLPAIAPAAAEACTIRVFEAANDHMLVTYCMGCKDQFLRQGRQAYHLLEVIAGVQPVNRPLSSIRKWANRLVLAIKAGSRRI